MATLRDHELTRHALVRMLREADMKLFPDEASQVTPEAYLLKDEDVSGRSDGREAKFSDWSASAALRRAS